jgi:hypothetical protein
MDQIVLFHEMTEIERGVQVHGMKDDDREGLQGQGHLVGGKEEQVLRLLLTVLDFDGISLQIIEILRKGGMYKAIFREGEDGLEVHPIHILLEGDIKVDRRIQITISLRELLPTHSLARTPTQ